MPEIATPGFAVVQGGGYFFPQRSLSQLCSQPGVPMPAPLSVPLRRRILQRWFGRHGQPPAPAGRKPASARTPAGQPHEVWQMDAVEQLPLQTGQLVCWLRWVDELTGAVLGTVVFPPQPLRPGAAAAGPA